MRLDVAATEKYDRVTIAFHWLVAVFVVCLWTLGQTVDYLSKGPLKTGLWSTHVVTGFCLVLVVVGRLTWRSTAGRHLPEVGTRVVRRLASAVHFCLYLLLFIVMTLGIANAFNRGYSLYGLAKLPQIGDPHLKHRLTDWHGLAANILLGLAAFHAAAGLFHHYFWKDAVLIRMVPNSAPR